MAPLALAGCGSGDAERGGGRDPSGTPLPPGHEDVRVIDRWARALAQGDVEAAADRFAVPSVAQNGGPPVTLDSREEVLAFNDALPCGGRLVKARPAGRYIAATFRLTERPGGDCGPGAGALARTAFVVRDGKIRQWRRLPDPESNPAGDPA